MTKEEWTKKYYEYLQSEAWQQKRECVLERDGWRCQQCFDKATEVHHLTYVRVFREWYCDLISLCHTCHAKAHGKLFTGVRVGWEHT